MIGNFDVRASLRDARWDGQKEQLEARGRQVPVALAHAGGAVVSRDEINALVRRMLTARHLPDRIYFIDRIPRTPSGKASHPELLVRALSLQAAVAAQ